MFVPLNILLLLYYTPGLPLIVLDVVSETHLVVVAIHLRRHAILVVVGALLSCLNMVDKLWHVYEFVMDDVLSLPDYYCRQPSPHAINITHFYGPIKSTIIIRNPHLMPKSIIYRCPDYIYRLAGGAAASALIQFPHQLRLLRSGPILSLSLLQPKRAFPGQSHGRRHILTTPH